MKNNEWNFPDKNSAHAEYELPDPFRKPDGTRISAPSDWESQRTYLKSMLSHYLYGHVPPRPDNLTADLIKTESLYDGKAVRETVRLTFGPKRQAAFDVSVVRPNKAGRFPVITWNDEGNATQFVCTCPIEETAVCKMNYCIAAFNRKQIVPDSADFSECSLYRAYPQYDWRVITMWAWAQSRIVDYLETVDYADMGKIVATGFSRGGKTALCAAVYDERFALCAAAGSGCCGGGCLRFHGNRLGPKDGVCETLGTITKKKRFWYWFSDIIAEYGNHGGESLAGDECLLPFDLHFVKALIAPRPLITLDGLDDVWSNPYGTYLTWRAAAEVYRFLGAGDRFALHFREGGHDYNALDWTAALDFCNVMLFGKEKQTLYKTVSDKDECVHFQWRMPV